MKIAEKVEVAEFNRFEAGDLATAGANLTASVALGLLATYAGLTLGRSL